MIIRQFVLFPHIIDLLFQSFLVAFFLAGKPEGFFIKLCHMGCQIFSLFQECLMLLIQFFPLFLRFFDLFVDFLK